MAIHTERINQPGEMCRIAKQLGHAPTTYIQYRDTATVGLLIEENRKKPTGGQKRCPCTCSLMERALHLACFEIDGRHIGTMLLRRQVKHATRVEQEF